VQLKIKEYFAKAAFSTVKNVHPNEYFVLIKKTLFSVKNAESHSLCVCIYIKSLINTFNANP